MTTRAARLEIPAPVALGVAERYDSGEVLGRLQVTGHWIGEAGRAVTRWLRAGQLDAGPSVELARWSGARR